MAYGLNLIQAGGACAASGMNIGSQINSSGGGFGLGLIGNGGACAPSGMNIGTQINGGTNAQNINGGSNGLDLSSMLGGISSFTPSADIMSMAGDMGNTIQSTTQQMMSNLLGGMGGGMDMSSLGLGGMPGMDGLQGCMQGSGFNGQCGQPTMYGMLQMMMQMMEMMAMMIMMNMMNQMSQDMSNMMGGGSNGAGGCGGCGGVGGANGAQQAGQAGNTAGGSGSATVDLARKYLGQTTHDIKGLNHLDKSIGYNLNCANFVSACLQQTGRLNGHYNGCKGLEQALKSQGWKQVPANQAQPGDVWFNAKRGHTELVEKAGNPPTLIGSNNGGDSIQEVSEDRGSGKGGVFYHKD